MKKLTYLLAIALLAGACSPQPSLKIENTSDQTLTDYLVSVERSVFKAGEAENVLLTNADGSTVPTQQVDADGDGEWETLLILTNLEPYKSQELNYSWVSEAPNVEARAKAYLGHSPERNNTFQSVTSNTRPADHVALSTPYLYQYEGPGWESDLVAFRSYFDSRNGKDIFGKTKPGLYTDLIGIDENYHEMQPWGMDILKVGSSLGSGALALLKNDSIYRLGQTEAAQFEVLENGPLRATIQLSYADWNIDGTNYTLEETISIQAGQRYFESTVKIADGTGQDTLVTGIVNLANVPQTQTTVPGWQILYSHGLQSENKDNLGMAVLVPEAHFAGFGEAPKTGEGVTNTHTAFLIPSDGQYRFRFYAGWEGENAEFANATYFENQVKATVNDNNAAVNVTNQ